MRALKLTWEVILRRCLFVTTQAHEGIETPSLCITSPLRLVTTQAHEGIETEKGAGTETGDEVTTQETPGGQAPLTKHEQKFE